MAREDTQGLIRGRVRLFPPTTALPKALLAGLVATALVSCAGTGPVQRASDADAFSRLGAGALAYFKADTRALGPVTAAFSRSGAVPSEMDATVLDRTDLVYGAFLSSGPPYYRILVYGDFPRAWIELSLFFDAKWKKTGGPDAYWRSTGGIGLVFERDGAVLASDGNPRGTGSAPLPPPAYGALEKDAAFILWFSEPIGMLDALGLGAGGIRVPVESLVVALEANGALYTPITIVSASSEREARALAALLRLARSLSSGGAGPVSAFFAEEPRIDGNFIFLRGRPLSADDLVALLDSLL